jgi:DNA-binding transcriptional MocR family regulator
MNFKNSNGQVFDTNENTEQIEAFRKLVAQHKATPETGAANSFLVGKEQLLHLLSQDNCENLRVNLGFDGQNMQIFLTGATSQGENLINQVLAQPPMCPPFCSSESEF